MPPQVGGPAGDERDDAAAQGADAGEDAERGVAEVVHLGEVGLHERLGQIDGEEGAEEEDEVAPKDAVFEQVGEAPGLPGGVVGRVPDQGDDDRRGDVEDDGDEKHDAHAVPAGEPAAGERSERHAHGEAREHVGDVARHAIGLRLEHHVDLERRVVGHVETGQQVAGDQPGPARRQRETEGRRHGGPPPDDDHELETNVVGRPGSRDVAQRRHAELDGDERADHEPRRAQVPDGVDVQELVVEPEAEREQQAGGKCEPEVAPKCRGRPVGALEKSGGGMAAPV